MSINPIDIKYFKNNNNLLPKIYEVNARIERGDIEILRKDIIKLKEQIKILTELVLMANKKYEKEEEKETNKSHRHYISYIPYLFPIPFYFLYKYYK